ncbi:MAG: undecaprenyl-diphosphate phosphatase [Pseudomonadota bacterium]
MTLFDIVVLALIQGITEFLPISSSGHLILWPLLTGRTDQGVTMDVAVHLGTLAAVMLFFRADMLRLMAGSMDVLRGRFNAPDGSLAILIAVATVPAVCAGLALKLTGAMDSLRSIEVIGWATLIGGVLLWLADRIGAETKRGDSWTLRGAVLMGLAQAVALIPGTSRSGACMTMARALGFERSEAARLALLMAVPTILAAGLVETAGVVGDGAFRLGAELALGAVLSFLAALAALWAMMQMFAQSWTMTPFVIYRLLLGTGLLLYAYS